MSKNGRKINLAKCYTDLLENYLDGGKEHEDEVVRCFAEELIKQNLDPEIIVDTHLAYLQELASKISLERSFDVIWKSATLLFQLIGAYGSVCKSLSDVKPSNHQGLKLLLRNAENRKREIFRKKNMVETIINGITHGIIVIDNNSMVSMINPAAEEILGLSREEIMGANISSLFFSQHLGAGFFQQKVRACFRKELRLNDRVIRFRMTPANFSADDSQNEGLPLGNIVLLEDITQEKEVDRVKTEFVCNVSHELRTPLASIKAYVETLLYDVDDEDKKVQKEFLSIVNDETDRLSRLVGNVLDISKMEAGLFKFNCGSIRLKDDISKAVDSFLPTAKNKKISLSCHFDKSLPKSIFIDADALKQLINNLVGNSIKYTPKGGFVRVDVKKTNSLKMSTPKREGLVVGNASCENKETDKDSFVEISVSDNGMGIPDAELPRIFDKFFQGKSSQNAAAGTGLGLALVKQIVEANKGVIGVISKEGKGSTFIIKIPLIEVKE
ncbi:MAG TPA: PAS domain-containing protein [Actinobacteria bacterium]|nr:PAS domain-containing protein [Actinomycetota bacterium]